jgi:DegV family protein with EDD domain
MNAQKIAILTDTGTNTPAEAIERYDIRVVPLRISFSDGRSYDSGIDITAAQLAGQMADETPKTSLPSPEVILQLLEQARADGYEAAVFVTISSGLSATCQSVGLVSSQMRDFPVIVIDTRSIGVAAGMVVVAAAELVEQGVPLRRVRRRLDSLAGRTRVFFSTPTLEFLCRGGRISESTNRLGATLDIKVVITCNEAGHLAVARKTRGWERSISAQVSLACAHARKFNRVRLAICCSETQAHRYDELEQRLRAALAEEGVEVEGEVLHSDASACLIAHAGPDLVGIAVQGVA